MALPGTAGTYPYAHLSVVCLNLLGLVFLKKSFIAVFVRFVDAAEINAVFSLCIIRGLNHLFIQ